MVKGQRKLDLDGTRQWPTTGEGIEHPVFVYHGGLLEFALSPRGEHPDYRFFPETGHLVAHGFLRYWERFGGLPVFGDPLTKEVPGRDGKTVQYFERALSGIRARGRSDIMCC